MKERKRLLIQENWEEKNIKFKHKKKTGNRFIDTMYSCKKAMAYIGITLFLGGCVYVIFDFTLQQKIVTAIESIFF